MNEIWKPVPQFPDYEVSNLGNVRSYKRAGEPKSLIPAKSCNNYLSVCLRAGNRNHTRNIHRLVLTAFVGECPEGSECRHLDGNKQNNRLDNLEWSTHEINCQDQITHGTSLRGTRQHLAKLTDRKVRIARGLHKLDWTIARISRLMGVTACTMRDAIVGNTWKHIID